MVATELTSAKGSILDNSLLRVCQFADFPMRSKCRTFLVIRNFLLVATALTIALSPILAFRLGDLYYSPCLQMFLLVQIDALHTKKSSTSSITRATSIHQFKQVIFDRGIDLMERIARLDSARSQIDCMRTE